MCSVLFFVQLLASLGSALAGDYVWTPIGWEGAGSFNVVAIDPIVPSTLYAGSDRGGYKSTDGGANWEAVNFGFPSSEIQSIAIDPSTPSTLYAGIFDCVYKSIDGGAHWLAVNSGLPSPNDYGGPEMPIAIDPGTPSTLYVGIPGDGVYQSTDGGAHWLAFSSGLPNNNSVAAIAIDPSTPSTLYAGGGRLFKITQSPTPLVI